MSSKLVKKQLVALATPGAELSSAPVSQHPKAHARALKKKKAKLEKAASNKAVSVVQADAAVKRNVAYFTRTKHSNQSLRNPSAIISSSRSHLGRPCLAHHSSNASSPASPPTRSTSHRRHSSPGMNSSGGQVTHAPLSRTLGANNSSRDSCRSARSSPHIRSSSGEQAESYADQGGSFAAAMYAYAALLQQQEEAARHGLAHVLGAQVDLSDVTFHPAGVERPLLNKVNMLLPANRLGLVMGRSGSGKTTLLQLLAGFTEQDTGRVSVSVSVAPPSNSQAAAAAAAARPSSSGGGAPTTAAPVGNAGPASTMEQRMQRVGLVFQFPERHFLGEDLYTELTFGWPQQPGYELRSQDLATRMHQVMQAVGLSGIPLSVAPATLSGGQQRRLALAIQLVRRPSLLLLDEPLAGLDWKARADPGLS
ncbi:MAG: hypothetical protein WDW36_010059 [Sanguina aurantia]